jgi:DNA invertase Pin-like site-specific DNA recombinase
MIEANECYQVNLDEQSRGQIATCMALLDARKEIKHRIKAEGRRVTDVPAKEINRLASALVEERRAEFVARAKASGVVREELRRLHVKEALALLRRLARKSKHLCDRENPAAQGLQLHQYHAQNGAAKWIVGYARVSTDGQTLDARQAALTEAGAERAFAEKQSGAKTDRAALARCLASLQAGDTLLVTKLDRLARSTRDLLNTLASISERGASFKSLGDSWTDTTTPHGRLMITVLGGLAEFERYLILSRTTEGRQRAKALGARFGRKHKLTKHQQAEARARLARGERVVEIARSYNVSHMTIRRLAGVTFMQ